MTVELVCEASNPHILRVEEVGVGETHMPDDVLESVGVGKDVGVAIEVGEPVGLEDADATIEDDPDDVTLTDGVSEIVGLPETAVVMTSDVTGT
jgi:hypothetical protein